MKAIAGLAMLGVLALSGCGAAYDPEADLREEARLAAVCHEAGGEYVYALWPGHTSAGYRCIWDGKKEW